MSAAHFLFLFEVYEVAEDGAKLGEVLHQQRRGCTAHGDSNTHSQISLPPGALPLLPPSSLLSCSLRSLYERSGVTTDSGIRYDLSYSRGSSNFSDTVPRPEVNKIFVTNKRFDFGVDSLFFALGAMVCLVWNCRYLLKKDQNSESSALPLSQNHKVAG